MVSAVNHKISRNALYLYHLALITSLTSSMFGSAVRFRDFFLPVEESGLREEYLTQVRGVCSHLRGQEEVTGLLCNLQSSQVPAWLDFSIGCPWWCLEMDGRCRGSFENHLVKPRRDSLLPSYLPLRGYVSMCS